jgi:hypothetical protein
VGGRGWGSMRGHAIERRAYQACSSVTLPSSLFPSHSSARHSFPTPGRRPPRGRCTAWRSTSSAATTRPSCAQARQSPSSPSPPLCASTSATGDPAAVHRPTSRPHRPSTPQRAGALPCPAQRAPPLRQPRRVSMPLATAQPATHQPLSARSFTSRSYDLRFWCLLIVAAYFIGLRAIGVLSLRYMQFLKR